MEKLTRETVAKRLHEITREHELISQLAVNGGDPFLIVYYNEEEFINNVYRNRYGDDPDQGWERFVEYDYDDSVQPCSECSQVVEISATHYGWQPMYGQFEFASYVCADCVREDYAEEYIEQHVNAHRRLLNPYVIDPSEHGWVDLELRMETGYHRGQNDNPQAIVEALAPQGIDCLFTGSVGQFDVIWTVWVREGQVDEARQILSEANTRLPYDIATEMSKALKGEPSQVKVQIWTGKEKE